MWSQKLDLVIIVGPFQLKERDMLSGQAGLPRNLLGFFSEEILKGKTVGGCV